MNNAPQGPVFRAGDALLHLWCDPGDVSTYCVAYDLQSHFLPIQEGRDLHPGSCIANPMVNQT